MAALNVVVMTELAVLLARGGEGARRAALTLRSYSLEGRTARDAALYLGIVATMLPYMRLGTPPDLLIIITQTLSNLCRRTDDEPPVHFELVAPTLPIIEDLLEQEDQEVLVAACTAIMNLTYRSSPAREAVVSEGEVAARLVALLSHAAPSVRAAALGAITNILAGTSTQVERCLDVGCLDAITSLLIEDSEPSLVEHAARAVQNICIHPRWIERALEKGVLAPLQSVLVNGETECRRQAASAVGHLWCHGTTAQRERVLSSDVLRPYCALLAAPDDTLATLVLAGLIALVQDTDKVESDSDSEENSKVKRVCLKLKEVGVLDLVQRIFQRQAIDESVCRKAQELNTVVRFYILEEDLIFEQGKVFTLAKIVAELQSQQLATQLAAARAARRLLARARACGRTRLERVGDDMVSAGVLVPLIAALDENDCSDLQHEAAWALSYVTSEEKHVTDAVRNGAIPKLVALLANTGDVRAAITLGNIATHIMNDAVLSQSGVVEALQNYMLPHTPPEQLKVYLTTYRALCRRYIDVSAALPRISDLLGVADEHVLVLTCNALQPVTANAERIEAMAAAAPRLTARLTALLGHYTLAVKTEALLVVRNILSRKTAEVERCFDAGLLDHLVLLLQCSDSSLVSSAAKATYHIFGQPHPLIQRALDKGVLALLQKALTHKEFAVVQEAVWAITYLCKNGSSTQRDQLVSSGVLGGFCEQLGRSRDVEESVIEGLDRLLEAARKGDMDAGALRVHFRSLGVRDMLQRTLVRGITDSNQCYAGNILKEHSRLL